MTLQQEAVPLHGPVDALVVRGLPAFGHGSAAQDRVHTAVSVGRQVGDDGSDLGHEVIIRLGRPPYHPGLPMLRTLGEAGPCDPDHGGDALHREPAFDESKRNIPF